MTHPTPGPERTLGGTTRYHCPVTGCDWRHDEHHDDRPGIEQLGPLRLSPQSTPEDVDEALDTEVRRLADGHAHRTEAILREHLEAAHPGWRPA